MRRSVKKEKAQIREQGQDDAAALVASDRGGEV